MLAGLDVASDTAAALEPEFGPVPASAVAERGDERAAARCHDREEHIQSEQQASVDTENLGNSQSEGAEMQSQAAEEAASTSSTGIENAVFSSEVLISQASCEGEDMDFGSESDTVSVCESNRNTDDLYSLEDINNFLDVTFKKSVKVSDYFSDTEKFIKSVDILKRLVGFDLLDEKNASTSKNTLQL